MWRYLELLSFESLETIKTWKKEVSDRRNFKSPRVSFKELSPQRTRVSFPKMTLVFCGLMFCTMPRICSWLSASDDFTSAKNVSGKVRLKLYKGNATVVGRSSDSSLYSQEHVTFEEDDVYDQFDAEGFIKLNALRLRLKSLQ